MGLAQVAESRDGGPVSGVLVLDSLSKSFRSGNKSVQAVGNVSLDIAGGELVTLLGPSGCGKTTTLRMIAGFETPTLGRILLDGVDISTLPPYARPISMVFQSYALFPHLTVEDNISFGLRRRKEPPQSIRRSVGDIMDSMGITILAKRAPHELSGGQQQRVALARALVMTPKVLLFDEPLSNLDAKLRVQMRSEIRRIQLESNITSVFVTHDQDEAMSMSDKIVVMADGNVAQVGSPEQIYRRPVSQYVADFIGGANILPCEVLGGSRHDYAKVKALGRTIEVRTASESGQARGGLLVIRPESLRVDSDDGVRPASDTGFAGVIKGSVYHGDRIVYDISTDGRTLRAEVSNPRTRLTDGEHVYASVSSQDAWLLPAEG